MVKGGQKLPLGQVAGAAKNNVIKGFNGYDLPCHIMFPSWAAQILIDLNDHVNRNWFDLRI